MEKGEEVMTFSKEVYIKKIESFIQENTKKGHSRLKISYSNVIELQKQRIKLIGLFERKNNPLTPQEQVTLKTLSFKLHTWLKICIHEINVHYAKLLEEQRSLNILIKELQEEQQANPTKSEQLLRFLIQSKTFSQILYQEKRVISHLNQILHETESEMNYGIPYSFIRLQHISKSNKQNVSESHQSFSSESLRPTSNVRTQDQITRTELPMKKHRETLTSDAPFKKVTKPIPFPVQQPFFEGLRHEVETHDKHEQTIKPIPAPEVPIFDEVINISTEFEENIPPTPTVQKDIATALSSIPLPALSSSSQSSSPEKKETLNAPALSALRMQMLNELTKLRNMLKGKI